MPKPAKGETLTGKQTLFAAHYLMCWNASEAARRAGYPEKTAAIIGFENLRKPKIKALIDAKMAENVMSADEVLSRLSQMASANLMDVLSDDEEFDYSIAKAKGLTHLIKKIKRRQFTDKDGNTTVRETEIELYDAQAALVHIGKHYKLFTTPIEVTVYDSLAKKLGISTQEARLIAERVKSGEVDIADVLSGKVKLNAE